MPTLVSHPDEVRVLSRRFGQGAADIEKYIELDGYKAVQQAIAQGPEWIVNTMKASGLRGRGGAGFPTGLKWSFVPKQSEKPKYVLVNGDESEPGTCKDHVIFREDPHAVIEGTMIRATASAPDSVPRGGAPSAELGRGRSGGTRLFGISGHVERPGVYEHPMGYNLKKAIYDVAGGIKDGKNLKAVVPGGSSCPVLLPEE